MRRIAGYNPLVSTMLVLAYYRAFALPIMSAIFVLWFIYKWITNPIDRQSSAADEHEEAAAVWGVLFLVAVVGWPLGRYLFERILYR